MKKIYMFALSALLLTACTQNKEVTCLLGNYTYKVSGVVTIDEVGDVHLMPETGTMTLTNTAEEGEIIMSFNHNGGDVYDILALVDSDGIYIEDMNRYIDVEVAQDTLLLGNIVKRQETFDVSVSGYGQRLSNGDISLTLSYEGQALNSDYTLEGDNIFVHCKRNAK